MSNGTSTPADPAAPQAGGGANRVLVAALVAVLLIAVGVIFYFVGHSAADADGAKQEGVAQGREAEAALYAQGTPRYRAIYASGFAAGRKVGTARGVRSGERTGAERGEKVGLDKGEKIGQLQGERQGIQSGANAALGGFGDWQIGSYYIVKFVTGSQGVQFAIDSRKQMAANQRYAICANNPADICTEPTSG